MNITIAAATTFEINENLLCTDLHNIHFLYTGIGMLASAVSLTRQVLQHKPDLLVQAGIAGCFDRAMPLGNAVVINKEFAGDTGVWEHENWNDLFDMKFLEKDELPFTNNSLINAEVERWNVMKLPVATGITVNTISTEKRVIEMMKMKYQAVTESMEGAALHYVGNVCHVPYIQVRALSNYVGERNKTLWKTAEAIANVNEAVKNMLAILR